VGLRIVQEKRPAGEKALRMAGRVQEGAHSHCLGARPSDVRIMPENINHSAKSQLVRNVRNMEATRRGRCLAARSKRCGSTCLFGE